MKLRTRLFAGLITLALACSSTWFMPSSTWTQTQITPSGFSGGSPPTSASTTPAAYGKAWFTANNEGPTIGFLKDDLTAVGYQNAGANTLRVWTSNDGGRSWTSGTLISGFGGGVIGGMHNVLRTQTGRILLIGDGRLIYADHDTAAATGWFQSVDLSGSSTFAGGAQASNGTIILQRTDSGGNMGFCRSVNNAVNWTCSFIAGTTTRNTITSVGNNIWLSAGVSSSGIYRSVDDGVTWGTTPVTTFGVTAISCPTTTICVAASGTDIYRSIDAGASWSLVTSVFYGGQTANNESLTMINYGGGIIDYLVNHITTANIQGYRSTDFGLTWAALPFYTAAFPGGNNRGLRSNASSVRNGRAIAFHISDTNTTPIYSPIQEPGSTTLTDANGQKLQLSSGAATGQVQVPVIQGDGFTDSRFAPWGVIPIQRSTVLNTSTVSAANTPITVTLTAVSNARSHIYKVSAFCSAGTSSVTIADNAVTIWQTPAAAVTAAPAEYNRDWHPGLTSAAVNTAMTVTLATCGAANTGTLSVQADKF